MLTQHHLILVNCVLLFQQAKQRAAAMAACNQVYGYQAPLARDEDDDVNGDGSSSSNESGSESSSIENSDASSSSSNTTRWVFYVHYIKLKLFVSQRTGYNDIPSETIFCRPKLNHGGGYSRGCGESEVNLLGHRRSRLVREWYQRQGQLSVNGKFAVMNELLKISL